MDRRDVRISFTPFGDSATTLASAFDVRAQPDLAATAEVDDLAVDDFEGSFSAEVPF